MLDVRLGINPRLVSSIKSAGSLAVFGAGTALELPLALFQVVMAFAEPATPRDAFDQLELDVDLAEFDRIIAGFVDRGLLVAERPADDDPGLEPVLGPRLGDAAARARIAGWLRDGRAVLIPDALPGGLADDVHRDLCGSDAWRIAEGAHDFFHYRNTGIEQIEGRSTALTACHRLFCSPATRRFVAELTGEDCGGEARVAAAWYRPGEYALPHDDTAGHQGRSVAYIWYLTRGWRAAWGGALFWCPTGQYICPGFNALLMFRVTPSNLHFICPVAPSATERRLTINGFWHRAGEPPPSVAIPDGAVISPRAYGPEAPAPDPEPGSVIVL
jgi:hypothetical protein